MKRIAAFLFVLALVAACSDLFDTAVQCTTDRDCQRYGAVCDVSHGVCVSSVAAVPDGSVTPGPPTDADIEDVAPPPPECNVLVKPVADIVPGVTDGGDTEITTSTTLDCTKDWRLGGRVFVRSGATLTIQAGTNIRAVQNAALVIQPGALLIAQGQRGAPIVFTSDAATPAPGNWRGLYVLGQAPPATQTFNGDANLAYGGANAMSGSGTLTFLRIEYSTLGLVLAGVGKGTRVEYVQVRKTSNDAFSFAGGTVDGKHLVAAFPGDEAFEATGGYAGRLQFLFAHQMSKDNAGDHNGLRSTGSRPVVYNATLCNDSKTQKNYAFVSRNASATDVSNMIFTGFFGAMDVVAPGMPTPNPLDIQSSIAFDNTGNPAFLEDPEVTDNTSELFDDDTGFDEIAWFNDGAKKNATTSPGLVNCNDAANPQPWPPAALTTNARTPPADGFFDPAAAYIGAFKDPNDAWMTGTWLRFGAQ